MREEKRALRAQMKQLRARVSDKEQGALQVLENLKTMPELQKAKSVLCYLPIGSELPTQPILDWLEKEGKQIFVPYTEEKRMYAVEYLLPLTEGEYGVPTPEKRVFAKCPPQVVLAPGLACDKKGMRLGYGGGYYDRYLAEHKSYCIAILFSCQLVEKVPCEPTDMPVDALVTPKETLYFSSKSV